MEKVYINAGDNKESAELFKLLCAALIQNNIAVTDNANDDLDYTFAISIGGDGTFLRTIKKIKYKNIPVLSINTGHMGFFADFSAMDLQGIAEIILQKSYTLQQCPTLKTTIYTDKTVRDLDPALNDVLIKHFSSSLIHLKLNIGEDNIETLSGDGVLISTPAGSTGYNYSLGGGIVDPNLNLMQITPVAPANNATYRSFTSSILIPAEKNIIVEPLDQKDAIIVIDGDSYSLDYVEKIVVTTSSPAVNIVRLPSYSFWPKLKSKFL